MGCAAALAVLDVFEKDKLLERSRAVGERLTAGLQALAAKHTSIGDVRGLGAMVAIELFKGGDVHQPDADLAKAIVAEAAKRGLILLSCGVYGNVIRILVPLTASDALLDEGLIGELVSLQHLEPIEHVHMTHSYVRGNWRNKSLSTPMILAKCCHDLDVLVWNLKQPVTRLSSVGSLLHFWGVDII